MGDRRVVVPTAAGTPFLSLIHYLLKLTVDPLSASQHRRRVRIRTGFDTAAADSLVAGMDVDAEAAVVGTIR